jgi:hypothetical protein
MPKLNSKIKNPEKVSIPGIQSAPVNEAEDLNPSSGDNHFSGNNHSSGNSPSSVNNHSDIANTIINQTHEHTKWLKNPENEKFKLKSTERLDIFHDPAPFINSESVTAQDLLSEYKKSPHSVPSLLLKYIVHRVNHLDDYKDQQKGHELDKSFMSLAQEDPRMTILRNGNISFSDLHEWTKKNGRAIKDLLDHKKIVNDEIAKGIGLNVRDIGGEKYVALTRGLESDIMTKDHPITSWADVPTGNFGSHQHYAWVPLKDIWFAYPHFHHGYCEVYGHEDEYLLSNTRPRYEARPEDVKQTRTKHGVPVPDGPLENRKPLKSLFDGSSDQEIVEEIKSLSTNRGLFNAQNGLRKIVRILEDRGKTSPEIQKAIADYHPNFVLSEDSPLMSREKALEKFKNNKIPETLSNPNLTTDDLINNVDIENQRHVSSALANPNADSRLIESIWNKIESYKAQGRKIQNSTIDEVADTPQTPYNIIDEIVDNPHTPSYIIDKIVDLPDFNGESVDGTNLTPEHTKKILDKLKGEANYKVIENLPHSKETLESIKNENYLSDLAQKGKIDESGLKYLFNKNDPKLFKSLLYRTQNHRLPLNVQGDYLNYVEQLPEKSDTERGILALAVANRPFSDEAVSRIATGNHTEAKNLLFRNKNVTVDQLVKIWPKNLDFNKYVIESGPTSDTYIELAHAIKDRKAYEERKLKEHIIKPFPKDLAKSQNDMWLSEVDHWLNDKHIEGLGYALLLPLGSIDSVLRNEVINPTWTTELLEGEAVIATIATPEHIKELQEKKKEDERVVKFKTDDKPQNLDVRVYWLSPVKISWIDVLDDKLDKSEINLINEIGVSDGLSEWEKRAALTMLGISPDTGKWLNAARFLSGGTFEPDMEKFKIALRLFDVKRAALYAFGISDSNKNVASLESIAELGGKDLQKTETKNIIVSTVEPVKDDGVEVVLELSRGIKAGLVHSLDLSGRHSKGAHAIRDPKKGHVWLIKPGSGGQSPAAGVKEEPASQSAREAAAWHIAKIMGLAEFVPECELIKEDGERECAAMRLLPPAYEPMGEMKEYEIVNVLNKYAATGELFRWACLDFVVGQTDRHSSNLLCNGEKVVLIDFGSAFANELYSPAFDKSSFIPYYLRYLHPNNFVKLTPEERVNKMPKLAPQRDTLLVTWFASIDPNEIKKVLVKYGISVKPTMDRLQRLAGISFDLSGELNKLFAGVIPINN